MVALLEAVPLLEGQRRYCFSTVARWRILDRVFQHGILQNGPVAVGKASRTRKSINSSAAAAPHRNRAAKAAAGKTRHAPRSRQKSACRLGRARMELRLLGGDVSLDVSLSVPAPGVSVL
jgi:hypothetical protein